ncbi:hypothetical protein [Pelosinus sp. UFO1]|nr:hypothetical protein [Pelosinus sp. UFO1]AIF53382.1 hypothetical protein UFO1_3839 [Pelosinus sp. UFO1]
MGILQLSYWELKVEGGYDLSVEYAAPLGFTCKIEQIKSGKGL